MDLLEYQGKELLRRFEVPVPEGRVASTPDEAVAAAEGLGGNVVLKAQVQIGGRGKAGGIKKAASPQEVRRAAQEMIGMVIANRQNPAGERVRRIYIERVAQIVAEYYCAFLLDRSTRNFLGMLSAEGGKDIEEVQARHPEAIAKVHIDPLIGMSEFHARRLVYGAGIADGQAEVAALLPKLYRAFVELDASLVEINPLVIVPGGRAVALDAKISLDDSAAYRHPIYDEIKAAHEVPEQERVAQARGLNFITLNGDIGIIGNGAGLVMATIDVVDDAGGEAANFLDVGGGASAETLSAALEVITGAPAVKSVLINIFGGITRCDLVAEGILDAMSRSRLEVPLVVRLDGTNAEEGRRMLAAAPHPLLTTQETMLDAARRAVELAAATGRA